MKAYQVQCLLPVSNPENNVVMKRKKAVILFEVPINYPNFEQVGFAELLRVAREKELLTESTALNNKKGVKEKKEHS